MNWDKSYEKEIILDLEWGDDEELRNCNEMGDNSSGGNEEELEQNFGNPKNSGIRSSTKVTKTPVWMQDYTSGEELSDVDVRVNWALSVNTDPRSYEEATSDAKWIEAMGLEIKAIEKNNTCYLTELPAGAKRIGVKWVYMTKVNEKGEVE